MSHYVPSINHKLISHIMEISTKKNICRSADHHGSGSGGPGKLAIQGAFQESFEGIQEVRAGATAGHSNATVKCILGGSSHFFCKWVLTLVKNGISGGMSTCN